MIFSRSAWLAALAATIFLVAPIAPFAQETTIQPTTPWPEPGPRPGGGSGGGCVGGGLLSHMLCGLDLGGAASEIQPKIQLQNPKMGNRCASSVQVPGGGHVGVVSGPGAFQPIGRPCWVTLPTGLVSGQVVQ